MPNKALDNVLFRSTVVPSGRDLLLPCFTNCCLKSTDNFIHKNYEVIIVAKPQSQIRFLHSRLLISIDLLTRPLIRNSVRKRGIQSPNLYSTLYGTYTNETNL